MLVNTNYGVQMSPQDARAWTLKEVIDYLDARIKQHQEGNPEPDKYPAVHLDRFFEAEEIKTHCEKLLNEIKW